MSHLTNTPEIKDAARNMVTVVTEMVAKQGGMDLSTLMYADRLARAVDMPLPSGKDPESFDQQFQRYELRQTPPDEILRTEAKEMRDWILARGGSSDMIAAADAIAEALDAKTVTQHMSEMTAAEDHLQRIREEEPLALKSGEEVEAFLKAFVSRYEAALPALPVSDRKELIPEFFEGLTADPELRERLCRVLGLEDQTTDASRA